MPKKRGRRPVPIQASSHKESQLSGSNTFQTQINAAIPLLVELLRQNNGACTNQAESFFSRIRRAEIGQHHHIAGKYLDSYAKEMTWREDNRRVSNGELYLIATNAALTSPVSRQWKGYWQRNP